MIHWKDGVEMTATTRSKRRADLKREEVLAGLSEGDRRLYESISYEVDYVPHPDYRLVATEDRLFGPEAREIAVHRWHPFPEAGATTSKSAKAPKKLSRADEAELFMRYNYARYRLATLAGKQRRRFSPGRVNEMIDWQRRVLMSRAALISANMPLVVAMGKRTRINTVEFGELMSEGNMALMRTVDKFDVSRGFKFSTYACRAILKAFGRLVTKTGRYRQQFPTEYAEEMERSDELVRRHREQRALAIEDLRRVLGRNMAELTPVEQAVVGARFAVAGYDRRRTLAEVGSMVGLSKERVRQVQNLALVKLRTALDDQAA